MKEKSIEFVIMNSIDFLPNLMTLGSIRVFLCVHVNLFSVVGRMHNDLRERDFNSGFVKHDL